jgi:hypothetical protein
MPLMQFIAVHCTEDYMNAHGVSVKSREAVLRWGYTLFGDLEHGNGRVFFDLLVDCGYLMSVTPEEKANCLNRIFARMFPDPVPSAPPFPKTVGRPT